MAEPNSTQNTAPTEDLEIKQFLEGHNPLKYVVAIETYYDKNYADLVIHNKETGKKEIRKEYYKPFVYIKDFKKYGLQLFGGDRAALRKAINKYGIKIDPLRVTDDNGAVVDRLDNGYKFMVTTSSNMGWRAIQNFFREGEVDMWKKEAKQATFTLKKPEVTSTGLYTFLEQKNGVQLYWNNVNNRFEAHFVNNFISTYRENKDDDENGTFIHVKGDAKTLVYNKEFSMFHYTEKNKYVIILNETKEDENEDIPKCHPALSHLKDPADYDEHIGHLKEKKEWTKLDAALHRKLVNAYQKKLATLEATGGIRYKKVTFRYQTSHSDLFFKLKNEEQFMISTGIRLFKGFETYDELQKLTFDIETEGLVPETDQIFKIGVRDNHGKSHILSVARLGDPEEEKKVITRFFQAIKHFEPAIIYGYHSENFDFWFILERARILGLDIDTLPTSLRPSEHKIKRKEGASLKLGGEVEMYTQTIMWGYTVLDILHAVRRTQAINSDIKEAGLKWICKYEKISKPDRVYIQGDKIMTYWKENKWFAVKPETNEYKQLPEELQLLDGNVPEDVLHSFFGETTTLQRGTWLVDEYLKADLWETEQVDERYNVDRFMVGKYMPTSFHRTCTMGGAAQWNLIMTAWSYEKGLAIPHRVTKHAFTGGLSRTFMLGKFWNVYKFDYSGLYPSLQLEYGIFPKHDVTNVLERLLRYFKVTRDVFKSMAKDESLDERTRMIAGTKQLPLKILNNSNFGANGSEVFNWSDFVCAERITCMGRLYLRTMIQYFQKYNCIPTVCDTDGINMVVPEMVDVDIDGNPLPESVSIQTYEYYNSKGKLLKGADALVEKFNVEFLGGGYMKLDNDGMWPSAINISRKNYANMEAPDKNGKVKIKYVGNTLKDKTMPEYVKEFIDKGITLLLENKPMEFVEYYYDYLGKICGQQIPLRKIANKSRVKMTPEEYLSRGTDKNGRAKGKQAHMELIIQNNLKVSRGDTIYYVNNGNKKSHSYTTMDKVSGKYMSYIISGEELENNPDKLGEYNVSKYVDTFNKRVSAIITPFCEEVRNTLIKTTITDRNYYTEKSCFLEMYQNPNPKDNIKNFFTLEPSEVAFWNRTGLDPYIVLPEFTTEGVYDGYEYQVKYKKVKAVMERDGYIVKTPFDRYQNGDAVITFELKWFAMNGESEELVVVPDKYTKILDGSLGYEYPLDEDDYMDFTKHVKAFGEDTKLKKVKEFFINVVKEGELVKVRQI